MKASDAVIGFGRHKGEKICHLRRDYLEYLLGWDGLWEETRLEIVQELGRRDRLKQARVRELVGDDGLTPEEPGLIEGVYLDEVEAGLFAAACAAGELVLTPDVPVASPLPAAWRRWCEAWELPHRVREVTWAEVEAALEDKTDDPRRPPS